MIDDLGDERKAYKERHKVHRTEVNFGGKHKDKKRHLLCYVCKREMKNKRDSVFERDGMMLSCGINKTTFTLQSSTPRKVIIKQKSEKINTIKT